MEFPIKTDLSALLERLSELPGVDPASTTTENNINTKKKTIKVAESIRDQLRNIISTVIDNSRLPQIELERLVDRLSGTIKRQVATVDIKQPWFSHIAHIVIQMVWGYLWPPKLHKKLIKVSLEMEQHSSSTIKQHLSRYITIFSNVDDVTIEDLGTWYSFVETSAVARELVGENLSPVISLLNTRLYRLVHSDDKTWTVQRQDWLLLLIKMCLQLPQFLPQPIQKVVYGTRTDPDFANLVQLILSILASQEIPAHCMPLAGTTIAFVVCLCPDPSDAVSIFQQIYYKLGKSEVISIGTLSVKSTPLQAGTSDSLETLTSFGHLSLLTGLLPTVRADMLSVSIVNEFENNPIQNAAPLQDNTVTSQEKGICNNENQCCNDMFVSWLFKLVIGLCNKPQHQNHAFRLLTNWYLRLDKYLTSSNKDKQDDHVESATTIESATTCDTHIPKTSQPAKDPPDDQHQDNEMKSPKQNTFSQHELSTLLLDTDSTVVKSTLSLVWTHLDSPVEGVNESVIEVLRVFLSLHCTVACKGPAGSDGSRRDMHRVVYSDWRLVEDLLKQALAMSWTVKGKHNVIAALMPYVKLPLLLDTQQSDLFPGLLNCISTNYLAPASTSVYRAVLNNLPRNSQLESFSTYCLPWLVQALNSPCSLLRKNANNYWLTASVKFSRDVFPIIYDYIKKANNSQTEDHSYICISHGLLAVMKAGKLMQLPLSECEEILEQALQHQDDDIRLDAFTILCVSQKTAEAMQKWELQLLRKYLPNNMTSDIASTRHQMAANVRTLLVRLRDSALAKLKNKSKQPDNISDEIATTLEFVEWIWSVLMTSLSPGASYQRLKTCLDWVLLILDTLSYQPHRHQRKGGTPDTVVELMALASSHSVCDFYNSTNTRLILNCLLHGTDEIRELSAGILLNYFPWPLKLVTAPSQTNSGINLDTLQPPSEEHLLLHTGLRLCNSAKPHESESGALLIKMLFQKLVVEKKQALLVDMCKPMEWQDGAQGFIHQLVLVIKDSLIQTQKNTLDAARKTPIHGVLLAVRRCLTEGKALYMDTTGWSAVIQDLIDVVSQVINTVLDVLGGKVHQDETAPSFEEMGKAISVTIAESVGDDSADSTELLSNDHRLLMTWSWVNIKEASVLLGCLVESLPLSTPTQNGVLTPAQVTNIGDVFLRILLQCRHRGAIEGCNLGLARFCEQLLRSSNQGLHAIPKALLTKVLGQIQRSDVTLSVTRRSAGLPLIITTIITAESKTRQTVLLSHVVTTLLSIASAPVCEGDQRADMPQVHAINILKAVLKDASVAMSARQYLPQALVIAIEGFASPHWAIQNAATQLFGVLVSRMLGQKRTHEDHVDLMTMPEFFAHYPTLESFLLHHLEAGAADQRAALHGNLRLQPTTFPTLSILARLSAGNISQSQASISQFQCALTQLLGCPVLAVRELAAQSVASLTQGCDVVARLLETTRRLTADDSSILVNWLHGDVLLCEHLLNRITSNADDKEKLSEVINYLTSENCWSLMLSTSPIIYGHYVKLLLRLLQLHGSCDESTSKLNQLAERIMQPNNNVKQKVGWVQAVRPLTEWYLNHGLNTSEAEGIKHIEYCLMSADTDVVLTTLQWLTDNFDKLTNTHWLIIQQQIVDMISTNTHSSVLTPALCLLNYIYSDRARSAYQSDTDMMWEKLTAIVQREKNSNPAGPAFQLLSVLLSQNLSSDHASSWCSLLRTCSRAQNSEWLHLHVAQGITVIAKVIPKALVLDKTNATALKLLLGLYGTGLQMLVSEYSAVRQAAAMFVSCLLSEFKGVEQTQPLHTTLALKVLCDVTFTLLAESHQLLQHAIQTIHKPDTHTLSQIITQETRQFVEDVFEAEDGNYYKENVALTDLICQALKKHVNIASTESDFTEQLLMEIYKELETAEMPLRNACSAAGPVNVSCKPRVYEAVYCRLCILSIFVKQCHGDKFIQLLHNYAQMTHLHPHLQSTAGHLAS